MAFDWFEQLGNMADPLGVFRESGVLGWDLAGADHTSEDKEAEAERKRELSKKASQAKIQESIEVISKNLTIIFIVAVVILIIWWMFKHGLVDIKNGNIKIG